ncbi:MAG: ketoacyl-ACP synthase III [Acidimicrobiia bacterium]|nr:ketoacyl-ACP synthase III [Acidimicrobiia bacterium]
MRYAEITGWGKCMPPATVSNAEFTEVMDTSDEWIITRTGIKERRVSHVENSDLAATAALRALACAGLDATEIDVVVNATCSPDRLIPAAGSVVQAKIGATNAGAMDVNAACSGFIYGLSVGSGLIASGVANKVLVIGVERLTPWLDFEDRSTAVLFGDGAGAVVLESSDDEVGMLSVELGSDGTASDILTVFGTGSERMPPEHEICAIRMDGREVFRRAVVAMGDASVRVVEKAGLDLDDISLLIPHQANLRIIDATARRLKLDPAHVFVNIASYGNTSAATIPIALTEALEEGRVAPGDNLVFAAFGGGLTWAAAVVRWGSRVEPKGTADIELPPAEMSGLEILKDHHRYRGQHVE